MAITTNSIMCFFNSIFFLFLHVLLLSNPMLRCNASNCLEEGSKLQFGTNNSTLISPGGVFELGFFAPDGNNNNGLYLGIWYYYQPNPKIIVWVANRDKPLLESNGFLVVEHDNAKVLDGNNIAYWSTDGVPSSQVRPTGPANSVRILCLMDSGNLVFGDRSDGKQVDPILWQSFQHPTDTFLPGMPINGSLVSKQSLNLTSWQNQNNPASGEFTFKLQSGTVDDWLIVESSRTLYWNTKKTPFDKMVSALLNVLSELNNPNLQNKTRIVMNFTGQIQVWNWESESVWSLKLSEPKDRCRTCNICGDFGSCNSNNGLLCKCLPGFKPSDYARWTSGDTAVGCIPISGSSSEKNNDTFYQLPMMTVGNATCTALSAEENCRDRCLKSDNCVAYSHGFDCSESDASIGEGCLIWNGVLTDVQEESPDGITIFVRTTHNDIEPTSRGCSHCGTYIIPYPLSTGKNCGDLSYFNFHCNATTGQVNFSTPRGNFRVTSIDPDAKNFTIQVTHSSCDPRYIELSVLSVNDSLPFTFNNCNVIKDQHFNLVEPPSIEVEIGWEPPQEPVCSASSDCDHWPSTTCKAKNGGERRCICRSRFRWNGSKLECTSTRVMVPFLLKVVLLCVAGALAMIPVCCIYSVYHTRKRRIIEGRGSFEIKGDDIEGIDVPFYSWENILAATNNFADANKLGTGGFGSVYKGKLPDEQEIAVKRLSKVSVQGVEEFRTEVKLIAKLQHRNLVRLIGYCMKEDEKILIYEYMPNGSLDSCLFDERHSVDLDWKKRFDCVLGIARGLLYLHQDSRLRIIHRDLKPSNILLDEELNPKISDFGIAKIVGGKETQASTDRVVGTYGYMSPEYAYEGIFSVKSDVFSFGVVILETLSGRRNSKIFMFEHGLSLLGHAWKLWNENKGLELMDPKLNESCIPSEVMKCIHIGLLCIQEDPSDRPTMSTVVFMLNGEDTTLPPAKQPAFMNRKRLSEAASTSSAMDSTSHEVLTVSSVGR